MLLHTANQQGALAMLVPLNVPPNDSLWGISKDVAIAGRRADFHNF